MIDYDDPKWNELKGGYKILYNPTSALKDLEVGINVESAWEELWNELHHQGDVGEASYAAVPHLVRIHKLNRNFDWNLYALISTIETERHRKSNPALPDWLAASYQESLGELVEIGVEDLKKTKDELTIRAILGALGLAKGAVKIGALISSLDKSEIEEYLDEHLGWAELYR
jgi:hypothetical protein